uniref:C2H2-type domain-containing protein n=1 Tax=Plectus sambesii TaxID=2011161 RepID=A0A914VYU7_9BILA
MNSRKPKRTEIFAHSSNQESEPNTIPDVKTDEADGNRDINSSPNDSKCVENFRVKVKTDEKEETPDFHELNEVSSDEPARLNRNQCPICFAQFDLEKSYVEHMWQVHGNKRPFRCEDCGLYLSYRSSLYNHRKIHSDKRPFSCTECSATFRWNNSLKYHMKRAHGKDPPWILAKGPPKTAAKMTPEITDDVIAESAIADADATMACPHCDLLFMPNDHASHVESCMKKSIMEVIQSISSQATAVTKELNLSTTSDEAKKSEPTMRVKHSRKSRPPIKLEPGCGGVGIAMKRQKIEEELNVCNQQMDDSHFVLPLLSEEQPLDEKLSQISARQEAIVRRLETFEQWVHERVGKMETILAALVAGGNLVSRRAAI